MKRSGLVVGIGAFVMVGSAALVGCFGDDDVVPPAGDDAGQVADGAVTPIDASLAPDTSPTPDAGLDTSSPDAASLDAGVDGDLDAGEADASPDGATDAAVDAGPPVVLVDGTTYPVLGFDFDDTTLALAPPARFTMSGGRLYWVSAGAPATTFEIRSLDAATLTGQRKENNLFCTSVMYLRAEATAAISMYRASSSSTGSNPQTFTLNRTPNVSRTGVATEGHCVATGCQTATHTYAIVGGSIVRTPK